MDGKNDFGYEFLFLPAPLAFGVLTAFSGLFVIPGVQRWRVEGCHFCRSVIPTVIITKTTNRHPLLRTRWERERQRQLWRSTIEPRDTVPRVDKYFITGIPKWMVALGVPLFATCFFWYAVRMSLGNGVDNPIGSETHKIECMSHASLVLSYTRAHNCKQGRQMSQPVLKEICYLSKVCYLQPSWYGVHRDELTCSLVGTVFTETKWEILCAEHDTNGDRQPRFDRSALRFMLGLPIRGIQSCW